MVSRQSGKQILAVSTLFDKADGFDDDRFDRHVLAAVAVGGRGSGDFVDHVHALGDLAEHRVTIAFDGRVVEERVVLQVDEELRGG